MKFLRNILLLSVLIISGITLAAEKDLQPKDIIKVSGSDYIEVLPDTAYFNLNVSIERDDPESAAYQGEKVRKSIKNILRLKGINSGQILQDATYMTERWDYKEKRSYSRYNFLIRLRLKDFDRIADLRKSIISEDTFKAVKEDWFTRRKLSINHSISYEVVEQKQTVIRDAFAKAYKNALEKVKEIAGISDLKYRIHRVEEVNNFSVAYRANYDSEMALSAMSRAKTNAEADQDNTVPTTQRFNSNVILEAEILY